MLLIVTEQVVKQPTYRQGTVLGEDATAVEFRGAQAPNNPERLPPGAAKRRQCVSQGRLDIAPLAFRKSPLRNKSA